MKQKAFIGIDLHTDNFSAFYLYKDGSEKYVVYPLSTQGFADFLPTLSRKDEIAVEATTNASFFRDQVKAKVRRVVVVAPGQFFIISKSSKKTDHNDAKELAFYLSKNLLPIARIKSPASQFLGSLINTRAGFVKIRTVLINRTYSILNTHGHKVGKSRLLTDSGYQRFVFCHDWPESIKMELYLIDLQVKQMNKAIHELEAKIQEHAQKLYGYENLLSIKGIGPLSAATLLWVIDNIEDFPHYKNLVSYFGIAPRTRESNNKSKGNRITKRGSKMGRTALIQCTWVAIRYNKYLREFYDRLKDKGAKKAIVACSRKFLIIIYETLKNDWVFEDFGKYQYRINTQKMLQKQKAIS